MTFKKFSGAGLAALVFALLLGIFLSAATFDHSYAQTPAAPASEPAAPEPPVPPCDAKMVISCSPNSGDSAWMMTSVALVLMMTIPGLGLFYGGMVRKKKSATPS
jgi:Amt family ammonium transporter